MELAPVRLREECWQALDERVRARLQENAGGIIDWWAYDQDPSDGRPSAVVFGPRELCFAVPSYEERPVYVISGYLLDPASARTRTIEHRPGRRGSPEWSPGPPPGTRLVDIGLPDEARGVLGNLPPQAQSFLQGPFTEGREVEDCSWHYEGNERDLDVFIIYLAGSHNVMLATGTKTVPRRHTDATAHWKLTCHQATVTGRRGL